MTDSLTYAFSDKELKQLALLFRKNFSDIPSELNPFFSFVEHYIYGSMTISEADAFFKAGD